MMSSKKFKNVYGILMTVVKMDVVYEVDLVTQKKRRKRY